ncbi:MAG: GTPase Era [Bacteroidales bacterium]|nr:GTPase Era [Bacteroidales bacterium]
MTHKAGFVNIIGKPNAGKSTLMNTLVGERLAIVTQKAQTTRHRILGIVNTEEQQIIYSDTPGIFDPAYKLQESMMNSIQSAFQDADVFLVIQEVRDKNLDEELIKKIEETKKPVILVLNKIDLEKQEEVLNNIELWKTKFSNAEIIPASALHHFNIESINNKIKELLPESPAYYDKDSLTDRPLRFFISEIIREKILLQYRKEIPYSVEVVIEEYKEMADLVRIRATIYVERESQRKILIGKDGNAIKGLGIDARKDIEKFIDQKIFLDLSVKVSKDWRDDDNKLKRFGYPIA